MTKKVSLLVLVVAAGVAAALAAGYTGTARSATSSISPLPSSSCGPVVYKGSGSPDFIVASDLPAPGCDPEADRQISRAILWDLADRGWKAGSYKIGYQSCDDSTAQTGGWDSGEVRDKRASVRKQQVRDRRRRDVQLGLCGDRSADARACKPRPDGDGQPGEHVSGPDEEVGTGRAAEVLPDGRSQLRARRRDRRLPGPGGRDLDEDARLQEGLRAQRPPGVRRSASPRHTAMRRRNSA